jgi:uncharacterized protein
VIFEFDPQKSKSNKAKHGIDFVEAQALWKSKHVILGAKDALERRYMVIGRLASSIVRRLSPIGARIRVSVRRSRALEVENYGKLTR